MLFVSAHRALRSNINSETIIGTRNAAIGGSSAIQGNAAQYGNYGPGSKSTIHGVGFSLYTRMVLRECQPCAHGKGFGTQSGSF